MNPSQPTYAWMIKTHFQVCAIEILCDQEHSIILKNIDQYTLFVGLSPSLFCELFKSNGPILHNSTFPQLSSCIA